MDTTNQEPDTCDKSPERIEKSIDALIRLIVADPFELPEAILLGMHFREDVTLSFVASSGDVYELLSDPVHKLEASMFDAIAVITCGWAAPFKAADDPDALVAPSESPNRVRVRVTLLAGVEGVCSSVRFANKPDDVLFDEGRGPLGDAVLDFWAR